MTDKTDQIATVEALDALPVKAVVLEAGTQIAYQKCDGAYWDGDAREWGSAQIALPALVLWLPRIVVPHEHEWVSDRPMSAATVTAVCVGCGATREEDAL